MDSSSRRCRSGQLAGVTCAVCLVATIGLSAQVTFRQLRDAAGTPANWLTYSGSYFSQRYSALDQLTPGQRRRPPPAVGLSDAGGRALAGNAARCRRCHVRYPAPERRGRAWTRGPGRVFWVYQYGPVAGSPRMLRVEQPRASPFWATGLFMATLDAHVVAH